MTDSPHNTYTAPGPVRTQAEDIPAGATERQRLAADPALSVWVSASAGTGKTSVLTKRVLRLLLPREDGTPGTPAARILCLTFTKAAASEMKLRLTGTLAQWATLPRQAANPKEPSLTCELADLLGRPPTPVEITAARRLFAAVVDTPGGLRIMTIHAFCTAILGTFPLEAGLPPQFRMLEDGAASDLMNTARNHVLQHARQDGGGELAASFARLSAAVNEESFAALLQAVARERAALARVLEQAGGIEGLHMELCRSMGLDVSDTEESIIIDGCRKIDETALRNACRVFADHGTDKEVANGLALQIWLDSGLEQRARTFNDYARFFLTKDGEILKRLATKDVDKADPGIIPAMTAEAERIIAVRERANAAYCAGMTRDLLLLCHNILNEYQRLKDERAALDFDDLILTTLSLLRAQNMVPWVMFKLDGGIDHILVDEAQDTNPEQWEIIRLLAADFFSGDGARADVRRTMFAVGDEKQSIYSFQRAAPEKFAAMRVLFHDAVMQAGQRWADVPLNTSFRTVPPVLRLVDKTFAPETVRAGVSAVEVEHISSESRRDHAGVATVWPLFISPKMDKESLWSPPVTAGESHKAAAHMASHIAATIKAWLDPRHPEILQSRGRPVQPGDIMILVRTRTNFVNQVIRKLKEADIPVGGIDRMVLAEQLVVRDMLAVAQASLLPADDLTLACVLKSPFIGWTDGDLEDLAAYRPRGQSLWDALAARHSTLCDWLRRQQERAGVEHPFEFFCRLAQEPCPADRISGQHAITARLGIEALDPMEEFLSAALAFEGSNIAALQDFLLWMARSDSQIKREQEEAGGQVRIMTVHGSKGLQAPICILPDTVSSGRGGNKPGERLLWPERAGIPLPLWAPSSARECAAFVAGKQVMEIRADEESRRLLYVAMTRAEDRLYVAGYGNSKNRSNTGWYDHVAAAINDMADAAPEPFAYPPVLDREDREVDTARTLRSKQIATPHDKARTTRTDDGPAADPDDPALKWLYHPPAAEPVPPQPLIPSRAVAAAEGVADAIVPVLSPLSPGAMLRDNPALRRGTAVHRLLQILPDMEPARRADAAHAWMKRHAADQPESLADDVMRILDNPDFAKLFDPGSLAEVPVTGLTPQGRIVSGQIDRLIVTDSEVWVVDYKTNRQPPESPAAIPDAYRRQMDAYAQVLAQIYPGKAVRLFLLWTAGPSMMDVTVKAS